MIVLAHIGPKILTDHSWITSMFKRSVEVPWSSLWSLNRSLLYSEDFCLKINEEIRAFFEENNTAELQDAIIWDAFKATLRGKFISQASFKKKETTLLRDRLLQEIEYLEKLHKQSGSPKILRQLNAARKSLDNLELPWIQKQLLYTKQKFTTKSSYSLKLLAWRV